MRVDTNIVMFPNPLEQCLRRKRLLKTFLQHYNLPEHLPVFSRIIFTSHVTILSVSESYKEMVLERVWRREAVVSKIESLNRQHSQCLITVKEMYRFARIVANHHLPAWFSPLKSFGLEFGNLRSGMYCERCFGSTLHKEKWHAYWTCYHCGEKTRKNYVISLQDYPMLNKVTITNAEARTFLEVDDRYYV